MSDREITELLLRVAGDLLAWGHGVQDAKDWRQLLFKAGVAARCAKAHGFEPFDHERRWARRHDRLKAWL